MIYFHLVFLVCCLPAQFIPPENTGGDIMKRLMGEYEFNNDSVHINLDLLNKYEKDSNNSKYLSKNKKEKQYLHQNCLL